MGLLMRQCVQLKDQLKRQMYIVQVCCHADADRIPINEYRAGRIASIFRANRGECGRYCQIQKILVPIPILKLEWGGGGWHCVRCTLYSRAVYVPCTLSQFFLMFYILHLLVIWNILDYCLVFSSSFTRSGTKQRRQKTELTWTS